MEVVGPEPKTSMSFNEINSWIKDVSHVNHKKEWKKQEGCWETKLLLPELNPDLTRNLLKLSRIAKMWPENGTLSYE